MPSIVAAILYIVGVILFAVFAFAFTPMLVMFLWNWLMPSLFNLPEIGFWQALGLTVLFGVLTGGFRVNLSGR